MYMKAKMLDPKCIYQKSIFAKCTRLACLLSFASIFNLLYTYTLKQLIQASIIHIFCNDIDDTGLQRLVSPSAHGGAGPENQFFFPTQVPTMANPIFHSDQQANPNLSVQC